MNQLISPMPQIFAPSYHGAQEQAHHSSNWRIPLQAFSPVPFRPSQQDAIFHGALEITIETTNISTSPSSASKQGEAVDW